MSHVVLALAGPPASGKTTVARAVGRTLAAPRVGLGDLVRARARERGLADNRTVWQDLGTQLLAEMGSEGMVRGALRHAGLTTDDVPVVWDGVRHVGVVAALRDVYEPVPVLLVALRPPEAERRRRFLAEAGDEEHLRRWERHETESHVDDLAAIAALVCTAATPEGATEEVERLIQCRGR